MNIILIGASGSGKTWISNVYGFMYAWKDTEFYILVCLIFFRKLKKLNFKDITKNT